jgi:hypothetical protein
MKKTGLRVTLLALVLAIGMGLGGGIALAVQGHMWNALSDLRAAHAQLVAAVPDKAGHRVNAINLVNRAIGEVQAGIAAGR